MKNTFLDYELEDGSKIQLTLNFTRLLQLRNKRKSMYDKYTNALAGKGDIFENSLITLYVAYLCANIEKIDNNEVMSYEKFIEAVPQDVVITNTTVDLLINPKKKKASDNRLLKQQEK